MTMKPGATTQPSASTCTSPFRLVPTSVMWPSLTATSARWPGAPVPSTTVPPRITVVWLIRTSSTCSVDRTSGTASEARPANRLDDHFRESGFERRCEPGLGQAPAEPVSALGGVDHQAELTDVTRPAHAG